MTVFNDRISGQFSVLFWLMVALNFVVPMMVLPFRAGRRPLGSAVVGIGILIGMWLERFLIVVPSLSHPRLGYTMGTYSPTWVEWGILLGSFGMLGFLYFTFVRLVPIVSIWEVREGFGREGEAVDPDLLQETVQEEA